MPHIRKVWFDKGQFDFAREFPCESDEQARRIFNNLREQYQIEQRHDVKPISQNKYAMTHYNGMMVINVELHL